MVDQPFSNREISTMFSTIKGILDGFHVTHENILKEVKTTNGKVADIQAWRERMKGALIIISILISVILVPLMAWMLITVASIDNTVQASVDHTLQYYEFELIND